MVSGSAAAVGTGAFETASADRTVNVNVAADSSGFVEISALNETYASGTSDGELELDFNSESGLGVFDGDAEGLNRTRNSSSTRYSGSLTSLHRVTPEW